MEKLLLVVDGEVVEITDHYELGYDYTGYWIECDNGCDYYMFHSHEDAGDCAVEKWQDMKDNDKGEFKWLIGDERLVQWACGESDSFGISSFDEFLEAVRSVPEEEWGCYDFSWVDVEQTNKHVYREFDMSECVIYRCN